MKKPLPWLIAAELVLLVSGYFHNYQIYAHAVIAHRAGASAVSEMLRSSDLQWALAQYVFAVLGLHSLKIVLCVLGSRVAAGCGPRARAQTTWLLWLGISITVELLNARHFPHIGNQSFSFISEYIPSWLPLLLSLALLATYFRPTLDKKVLYVSAALVLALTTFTFAPRLSAKTNHHAVDKPNLIIIGIDSLRMDKDLAWQKCMPTLARKVAEGLTFENSLTPIARTHPAWMSILSGQYPVTHGVRFNLVDAHRNIRFISQILQKKGYRTIFASDETRFSNILPRYGFDQIVGPRPGAQDFLLGAVHNDSLTNIMGPTPLGAWLFPEIHGNRAVWKLYDPRSFNDKIDRVLDSGAAPLFLAAHFTLAHWPYVHATSKSTHWPERTDALLGYCSALTAVDQQIQSLFSSLRERGVLRNALIVILSDHGERVYGTSAAPDASVGSSPWQTGGPIESDGHGTAVADTLQSRVLLSISSTDLSITAGKSSFPATLVDVAPTVVAALGMGGEMPGLDGVDLIGASRDSQRNERVRFIESGLMVPAILSGTVDEVGAFRQSQDFYHLVSGSTRLNIRHDLLPELVAKKQLAAVRPDLTGVALVERQALNRCPRLLEIDMANQRWREAPQSGPAMAELVKELEKHFAINMQEELHCGVE